MNELTTCIINQQINKRTHNVHAQKKAAEWQPTGTRCHAAFCCRARTEMAGAGAQVQKLQADLAALRVRLSKADGRVQTAEAAAAGQAAAAEEVQESLKASQEAASKLKAEVSRPT